MKKPRLTDADRLAIETGLRSGKTVYCIAKELSRPVTTVTREIRARAVESDKVAAYRVTPFFTMLKSTTLGIESFMTSALIGFELALRRHNLTDELVHPCDGLGSGWQDVAIVEKIVPCLHIEIIP